jgi:hypothetical protein
MLVIGESGSIKGTVKAQDATIAGTFNGDLTVSGKLELLNTAKIFGEIRAGSLVTSDGAIFQGTCTMPGGDSLVAAAASASSTPSFDASKKRYNSERFGTSSERFSASDKFNTSEKFSTDKFSTDKFSLDTKSDAKPDVKSDAKPDAKPDGKQEGKSDGKQDSKF